MTAAAAESPSSSSGASEKQLLEVLNEKADRWAPPIKSDRGYYTISDYLRVQREMGSCIPEMKVTMKKAASAGLALAPIVMLMSARRNRGLMGPRTLAANTLVSGIATVTTFSVVGFLVAGYNCLHIE